MTRPRVRLLEDRVVDQIAAGEVVERPASVVKELVENALDAGARDVRVTLKDGGRGLVRVADDGHGMDRDDALLAIERHATSKIRRAEDLLGVRTLGFRGEALPSIAAVSRFELVTRPHEAEAGTRIRMEAGSLLDCREVGAAAGTVVSCRDLFHALPARRAFLRSAGTELGHGLEAVGRVALARTDVSFLVEHDGRTLLDARATSDPVARAAAVLGDDGRRLVPVDVDGWLVGLAAPPGVHRPGAAAAAYLYVNGRWVRDALLRRAVRQAYRDLVPEGRYPVVVLDLRVEPGGVDVNVHPTKAEVRFRDPSGIAARVAEGLRAAIGAPRARPVARGEPLQLFAPAPPVPAMPPEAPLMVAEPAPAPAPVPAPGQGGRILAVLRRRWAVTIRGDDLVLLDVGRLATRLAAARAGEARRLLVPAVVRLGERGVADVQTRADELAARGIVASRFSPAEVAVRALPEALGGYEPADVLRVALAGGDWGEDLPPAEVDDADDVLAEAAAAGLAPPERAVPL